MMEFTILLYQLLCDLKMGFTNCREFIVKLNEMKQLVR